MSLLDRLLQSDEPSIRLQIRAGVQRAREADVTKLRAQIRDSPRVATLLSERGKDGTIDAHPYPAQDDDLIPLRDQMIGWLFSKDYLGSLGRVQDLPLLHGSIEGNALWAMLSLGLADERAEALAERLRTAQWPDGGWNCDRNASGRCSSLTESLIPFRA